MLAAQMADLGAFGSRTGGSLTRSTEAVFRIRQEAAVHEFRRTVAI